MKVECNKKYYSMCIQFASHRETSYFRPMLSDLTTHIDKNEIVLVTKIGRYSVEFDNGEDEPCEMPIPQFKRTFKELKRK